MHRQDRITAAALLLVAAAALPAAAAAPPDDDAALQHARRLLKDTILIDGHNDLPWQIRAEANSDVTAYDLRGKVKGQTDLKRLREGGVGGQFWSVWIPSEGTVFARVQLEQIELVRRLIAHYPEALRFAGSAREIRAAKKAGRIASLIGIEGGQAIENSMGALRAYYDLGVRYMTLTHNNHNDWADSATESPPRHGGLSPFGEEVVREMNRLGMLLDLSHVSPETMADALRVSAAPVIFSHSNARALVDVRRNVPDDILRQLPANGGVVMASFVAGFIDSDVAKAEEATYNAYLERARAIKCPADRLKLEDEMFGKLKLPPTSIAKVADHIEHIRKVAGVDHVGLGSDYDGNTEWPVGMEDVSSYPKLFAELIRRGWKDAELKKLAGENVLRALERAEAVAAKLQKTTKPSVATLPPTAAAASAECPAK
jgi:membrane dipeptidase